MLRKALFYANGLTRSQAPFKIHTDEGQESSAHRKMIEARTGAFTAGC
jgi:hypothetical protein